jgi:hypothetical protein
MKVFKEEQRFTQTWLILILAISIIVPVSVIIKKYLEENTTITTKELAVTLVVILVTTSILFIFNLTTKIDEIGIHYQFFPFHFSLKTIYWKELSNAYVRTYSPITEYGGWGLKGGFPFNKNSGKAINVSGDIGIQLKYKNGKKLLIGTQKRKEANQVLETYKNKIVND